ncbi:MAG: NAD(P)H-hydrate dehydratase [Clostridiales bacterium]|nr:NAD(P)H-hydrate dehydratase [Clostridiales bacterium]
MRKTAAVILQQFLFVLCVIRLFVLLGNGGGMESNMDYILTGKQAKQVDEYSIQNIGIPSVVLMERAAMAVTEEIIAVTDDEMPVLVLAGVGNNGADGLAVARMLSHKGYRFVDVLVIGNEQKATKEWLCQKNILDHLQICVRNVSDETAEEYIKKENYKIVVDALFGIGLTREVKGVFEKVIDQVNQLDAFVVAVDIASGIHSDLGTVMNTAIMADMTVTFGWQKMGQVFYPGAEYTGKLIVRDIGFPEIAVELVENKAFTYTKQELELLPYRRSDGNKGSFGKVVIIAGSKNMAGAAYLSAASAYAIGAGLVKILTVEENREILQTLLPEAIMTTYNKEEIDWEIIREAVQFADVIVLGPGLSQADYAGQLVDYVMKMRSVPLILDADGINLLVKSQKWCYDRKDLIMTPHLGEFSRLTSKSIAQLKENLPVNVQQFAQQQGVITVCKDARTIVAAKEEPMYINKSGNSGMAVGGSGDVLTGIIAGLIAGGSEPLSASYLGVYLHGLAGDWVKEQFGEYSMKASDLVQGICAVTNGK